MVNMAHLKGNLGLKSSSLAPTACKLSTQYMVLDHMTNHYNKISQAKSAIDNKPPKSMVTSQKMRDRKTRERALSPHRNRPLSSMSHTQGHMYHEDVQEYQDFLNEEPEDEQGRLVQSIMKTTLTKKSNGSNDATFNSKTQTYSRSSEMGMRDENGNMAGEHQRLTWQRPMSARSGHSVTSSINGTQRVPITSHDQKKLTYNGDILDKRSSCFTEPSRPFTPRTLKSNHQSRLKSSKCYNAPKPKSGQQSEIELSAPEQGREREFRPRRQPQPKPRQRNRSGQSDQFGETMPTNQLSESMLMDITLQSRDGRHSQEGKRDVPPLAISMDTDHFKWLQEQASKAQVRARHGSKIKPGLRPDVTKNGMEEEGEEESPLNLSHSIRLETLKKEEEQKYLAFAKEVTDDVLTRGISTDKVLHRVFENHIERRKGDLDETRMRSMIKDLKKDLGLRDISVERKESHTVNFSNMDKDKSSTVHSLDQDAHSVHSESRESLSSKPGMNYNGLTTNSNMTMTMDSTSTMKFGQTGDLFSTIHSEQQDRNLSDGEVNMSDKETDKDENELTATQVLKEYQMNLTAKEASGDGNGEVSSSEIGNGLLKPDALDERPATGERRTDQESSTENGKTTTTIDFSTANGSLTTADSHGNHVSSQDSSTLNGSLPRSRLRNRRRERNVKSSTASADSGSIQEEPSSNSALKSSTSVETGSERDMSESGQEMYSKPVVKPRARPDNKNSNRSEPRESPAEEAKSTDRSDGSAIGEDYAGDYEDDYDEASQDNETHRTSDDDF